MAFIFFPVSKQDYTFNLFQLLIRQIPSQRFFLQFISSTTISQDLVVSKKDITREGRGEGEIQQENPPPVSCYWAFIGLLYNPYNCIPISSKLCNI